MANKKKKTKKQKKALRNLLISFIVIVVLFILLCYMTPEGGASLSSSGDVAALEIPDNSSCGGEIIQHTGYTLSYNEEYETANWVAYELTKEETLGSVEREDSFKPDPTVSTGSATLSDYRNSGYDRGHLAPAADFKWSSEAMSDTFFMSNMSAQDPSFNRGIWADLESAVRTMAYDNEKIYVVTGPVLTDGPYETIGKNNVAVPKRFYKVILDYTDPDIKAIGFVLPNQGSKLPLSSFAMSVDEVEEITGIDFFYKLPDEIEEQVESTYSASSWSMRNFSANGETAEVEYVAELDPAIEIKNLLVEYFTIFKKSIFEYTGTTEIAEYLGLI